MMMKQRVDITLKPFLWMLFIALFACGQKAWAQFSGGDGLQATPYQISSIDDWNALASAVNSGTSYSGAISTTASLPLPN